MQRATAFGGSRSQVESAIFVQFNGLPRREQAARRHVELEMIVAMKDIVGTKE